MAKDLFDIQSGEVFEGEAQFVGDGHCSFTLYERSFRPEKYGLFGATVVTGNSIRAVFSDNDIYRLKAKALCALPFFGSFGYE